MAGKGEPSFSISSLGFGFSCSSSPPLPPLPPCIEVLSSEVASSLSSNLETVSFNSGFSLRKGRISTGDVFPVPNSDLIPGKYEGGLKLWEGAIDLINCLCTEVQAGRLSLAGKRVLELGCGHGLPGIYACLEGAAAVDFQDFNVEVLRCLTIPNVEHNLAESQGSLECKHPQLRFVAGDWSEVDQLLLREPEKPTNDNCSSLPSLSSSMPTPGYDVILTAETVYSLSSLTNLYGVMKKCLCRETGVAYVAGKKHYFGVGGGTRQFLRVVDDDGEMEGSVIAEIADGSSNVREVWKFSFKSLH
ncbi:putative methyltransferase family protein isoform X2 [Wolffia australiana]